VIIKKISS